MKKQSKLEEGFGKVSAEVQRFVDRSYDIADHIALILEHQNMSQKELAEKLGKKESQVSKWLRGGHNFTLQTIAEIEAALGEDIIYIPLPPKLESVYYTGNKTATTTINIRPESEKSILPEKFTTTKNLQLRGQNTILLTSTLNSILS